MRHYLKILLILIFAIQFQCRGEKAYGEALVSRLVKVIDGDTFICDIEGFPDLAGRGISIRIHGIDTPEKNDSRREIKNLAMKAREHTEKLLNSAKKIELKNMRRGLYFRIVADVWLDDKIDLGKELLTNGLAKPCLSKKRTVW